MEAFIHNVLRGFVSVGYKLTLNTNILIYIVKHLVKLQTLDKTET